MKLRFKCIFLILPFLLVIQQSLAQEIIDNGELKDFFKQCIQKKTNAKPILFLEENEPSIIQINVLNKIEDEYEIVGNIIGFKNSTFIFTGNKNGMSGKIIMPGEKKAYALYTEKGKIKIQEVNSNKYVCSISLTQEEKEFSLHSTNTSKSPQLDETLESAPNSKGTIYLDFNGQTVNSIFWNGGIPFECLPSRLSEYQIMECYKSLTEDFNPFNVNVTTNEQVFLNTPKNKRIRVIFTPTTLVSPGSCGVAWTRVFSLKKEVPCFVFDHCSYKTNRTAAHEIGHTFGLSHDGTDSDEYYEGHNKWMPIMGSSPYHKTTQWSNGEYATASNQEDDLSIISSNLNGIGYKEDQHADDYKFATPINSISFGAIRPNLNNGVIEQRNDIDFFKFQSSGGQVSIRANPHSKHPNLDIQLRLLDENGNEIARSTPDKNFSARIDISVNSGLFYIEIDGVGEGNPLTNGYSDYGSIGYYELSGYYSIQNKAYPPFAKFRSDKETICIGDKIQFTDLSAGDQIIRKWIFEGGTPETSNETNPLITYFNPGVYKVSLEVSNSEGTNTQLIEEMIHVGQTNTLPMKENFEGSFPPKFWKTTNPDKYLSFEKSLLIGFQSKNSMVMDNSENYDYDELDEVWIKPLNLSNSRETKMTFDLAYTLDDLNHPDELRVFVSTECTPSPQDWTEVFFKSHVQLETKEIPESKSYAWTPSSTDDWRTEKISLSNYDGTPYLLVKFQNKSGYGNRIWIDNVNFEGILSEKTFPENSFSIYPNPTQAYLTINPSTISEEIITIEIYNSIGQKVKSLLGRNKSISVEHFSPGVYLIHLIGKTQIGIQKFVKQ